MTTDVTPNTPTVSASQQQSLSQEEHMTPAQSVPVARAVGRCAVVAEGVVERQGSAEVL